MQFLYEMKTVLVTVEGGFIHRNVIQSDIFRLLKEDPNTRVVLLVPEERFSFYKEKFDDGRVMVDHLPPEMPKNKLESICYYAMINSVPTRTTKIKQWKAFYGIEEGNWLTRFLFLGFKRLNWWLGHFTWWRKFLRFVYRIIPSPVQQYDALFETYKPDLVFATNLLRFDEFRLLKAGYNKGIKTASMILSWDNLSSKLFMAFIPDQLIVYNERIKKEARAVHDVPNEITFVSGIPQYDYYFLLDRASLPSREVFLKEIGADPNKKIILYACSSKPTSPEYVDIFTMLNEFLMKNQNVQILIRPYPKYPLTTAAREIVKNNPQFVVDEHMTQTAGGEGEWNVAEDHNRHAALSFLHSDVVVSTFSTFQIEAAIFDKAIVNINFDGMTNKPYYDSIRRMMDYTQYEGLIELPWMWIANTKDDLFTMMQDALARPAHYHDGRMRVVREQCFGLDGKAGERAGKFLLG